MAKQSYLHGGIFKLYGADSAGDVYTDIISAYSNAVDLGEIELLLPDVTVFFRLTGIIQHPR